MPEIIERTAKLFEAGKYPDKGIEITTDNLDAIAAGFGAVPVKVEHTDTPFDGALGNCSHVWREGNDLKGIIGFSPEAWGLIDKAGAKKLSVGILRDLSALTEVSLVNQPRVQGATVFGNKTDGNIVEFIGQVQFIETMAEKPKNESHNLGGIKMADETKTVTSQGVATPETATFSDEQKAFIAQQLKEFGDAAEAKFSTEIAKLTAENKALADANRTKDVQFKLDEMKRSGKLVPAGEPFARAILTAGSVAVTFGDKTTDIAQLFAQFVETLPEIVKFDEQGEQGRPTVDMSSEAAMYYEKLTGKKMEAK